VIAGRERINFQLAKTSRGGIAAAGSSPVEVRLFDKPVNREYLESCRPYIPESLRIWHDATVLESIVCVFALAGVDDPKTFWGLRRGVERDPSGPTYYCHLNSNVRWEGHCA
jgi:hypothetical protein